VIGMSQTVRKQLAALLADLDQQIAKAEALTVARGDDDTLQRASKCLKELREAKLRAEARLRAGE